MGSAEAHIIQLSSSCFCIMKKKPSHAAKLQRQSIVLKRMGKVFV